MEFAIKTRHKSKVYWQISRIDCAQEEPARKGGRDGLWT